jgi:hypothetical protein
VIERRQHLCFALKPRQAARVEREQLRLDFQRDVALQPGIARAIDFAHAATANRRDDLIDAELRARCQSRLD